MPILKIRLALVLGGLSMSALLGLVSTLAWLTNNPPVQDVASMQPKGKGLAEIVAESWLGGRPVLVPVLKDVALPESKVPMVYSDLTWEGYVSRTLPSGVVYELHRMLVLFPFTLDNGEKSNRVMRVYVTIALGADGKPYLATMPSLAAVDMRDGQGRVDYTDLSPKDLPSSAIEQIDAWATAWSEDDRDQLKLLTGDITSGIEYTGLGGFSSEGSQVIAGLPAGETIYGTDTYLVRVRISLTAGGANQYITETDMDLTMIDTTTGLPRIVGWGPAGAGLRGPSETRQTS